MNTEKSTTTAKSAPAEVKLNIVSVDPRAAKITATGIFYNKV